MALLEGHDAHFLRLLVITILHLHADRAVVAALCQYGEETVPVNISFAV